jgi:quercetin dioxygenase-like cupin family protein
MQTPSTLLPAGQPAGLSLAEATQFSDKGIVSRALVHAGGLRVTLFGFAAGQELTEHASPARATIQVLAGRSEWTVAGEPKTLSAGDFLHLPPGTPHAVRAPEAFSMLLTLVREAAPARASERRAKQP